MRLCIVGHGPSLLEKPWGTAIDSHDYVVRIKQGYLLRERPEQFGAKMDALCFSWNTAPAFMRATHSAWVFVDSRHDEVSQVEADMLGQGFSGEFLCDTFLCRKWDAVYREIRNPQPLDKLQETKGKLSDEKGHKHLSAGLHAILYAMEYKRPRSISLYGFDNVVSGTFTWSMTRGQGWTKYPDHNWRAERTILEVLAHQYGYSVKTDDVVMLEAA